jgi:hypothetical protein
MAPFLIVLAVILATTSFVMWQRDRKFARIEHIRTFSLPPGLYAKLQEKYPGLALKDCQLVGRALRQFFLAYAKSGYRHVSMPSQVVDDLWHEYILYTRDYETFCKAAFGRFFHHTPAARLSYSGASAAGLRRCWWHVCAEEYINPKQPQRLPLLFAIDSKFNIPNGFHYVPDCNGVKRQNSDGNIGMVYCGGDFGDASLFGSDAESDGFGGSGSWGGWSDGGGGDGGGGDGGGCGGD